MPRTSNQAKLSPDQQLALNLLNAFQNCWAEQLKASKVDPVKFSQMSTVALTQLGAIIGVDVGMTIEQFTAVCQAQFNEAHARAPRFS